MTFDAKIVAHSGFATPPVVVVTDPTAQSTVKPQDEPKRPALRLVR